MRNMVNALIAVFFILQQVSAQTLSRIDFTQNTI